MYSRNNNGITIVRNHRMPADVVHKSRVRREIQTRVAMRFLYMLLRPTTAAARDGFRVGTHVMLHSNDALRYIMGTAAVCTCARKFTFVRVFSKSYSHVVFFFSIWIYISLLPSPRPSSYLAVSKPYSLLFVSFPCGTPTGHSCTALLLNMVIILQI